MIEKLNREYTVFSLDKDCILPNRHVPVREIDLFYCFRLEMLYVEQKWTIALTGIFGERDAYSTYYCAIQDNPLSHSLRMEILTKKAESW
jgi:hypothetical protein